MPQDLSSSSPDYLTRLNPEQRQAIETIEGPLLILAGAGTGKTRVLTTRFAHILLTGNAYPGQILAVTFTNKAAREMRDRVGVLLAQPVEGLWLGTFHAICARMLRRHAEYVGLRQGFTILDTDDQLRLLKQIMGSFQIDIKRWPPNQMMGIIQRWKDRGLTPGAISAAEDSDFADGQARALYQAYQERLLSLNACDFGDLMLHMVEILKSQPNVLAQYHRTFRYILVDEYQDTNTIQYLWLRLLAKREQGSSNIACVGDDDQSIYSWRGAEIDNILRFEQDFPGARIVRLERNYRSTEQILAAASGLIAHNDGRLGKTLRSGKDNASGEKVKIIGASDSDEEARIVASIIQRLGQEEHRFSEMAILMRAGFQTRAFEERLLVTGIPYRIVGGVRFYERAEIRDCLAYMRILAQPADDLAFERIVNIPRRGVGAVALQKFRQQAQVNAAPLLEVVKNQLTDKRIKGKSVVPLQDLMDALDHAKTILRGEGLVVAVERWLEDAGYLQMWRDDRSIEAPGRLENIRELFRALGDFPTLEAFLEHVALVMDTDNEDATQDRLNLMTIHGAKGLEFDTVFLPGWEEGLFPSQRSLDEGGEQALEEERRLAYVALTRARIRAIILHADRRRIYANWQPSMPSRFIDEIPSEHVMVVNSPQHTDRQAVFNAVSFFATGPLMACRTPSNASQDARARTRPREVRSIAPGTTVFHSRFGEGVVISADGERLDVHFEDGRQRCVMAGFLEIRS